jgi:hypothetical protein
MKITAGTTGYILDIFIQDSSATDGAGLAGLVYNTASLTAKYKRQGSATWTTISLATATAGTWASGGFVAAGSADAGDYELHLPNAAIASGVAWVAISLQGAANMAPTKIRIGLTATNDQDAVRAGMTALPNAEADAAGGLPISVAGALDLDAILADTDELQINQGDWLTATGFSTHTAADVYTEFGDGANLTALTTATGFSTHSAADVYTEFGDGSNLTTLTTATGFSTQASVDVIDGIVDAILVDTADLQTNQGSWLTATGFATQASVDVIDGIVDTILVDTNDLQTNQGSWLTATGFSTQASVDVIDGIVDSILIDTDELQLNQGDWVDSGLGNNFDPAVDVVAQVTLVDTTSANTDMRGTNSASLAATALSTVQWTNTLATNIGTTNTTVATNLDATVSSRLATSSYSAPPSAATVAAAVETAILDEGDATALLAAIAAKVETFLINEGDATATIAAIAAACNAAVTAAHGGGSYADTGLGNNLSSADVTAAVPTVVQIQTGLSTQASVDVIDGIVDAILIDTNELQTNQSDWATATGFSTHSAADVLSALGTGSWATSLGSASAIATAQADLDIITGADGVNLLAATQATIDAILADTNELQTNQGDWVTATGFSTHSAADVYTEFSDGANLTALVTATGFSTQASVDVIDGIVDSILIDTNELQTNQGDWLTATGFSTQASVDVIDGIVDTILIDTDELQTNQGNWTTATGFSTQASVDVIDGIVDSILVDTNELQTNQGGWVTATGFSTHSAADVLSALGTGSWATSLATQTSVADLPTNAELTTALGTADDATLAAITAEAIKTAAIKTKTDQFVFTVANQVDANALSGGGAGGGATASEVRIEMDANSTKLASIVADTNELQTNQGDWLTATGFSTQASVDTIDGIVDSILLDTNELQLSQGDWATATGFSTHAASDVYTAFGDGSNLTTLTTATGFATVNADNAGVAAIKTKTDQLVFTVANQVDSNALTGGGSGATASEVRIEMDANSTKLASILVDTDDLQTNQGGWVTATGFSTHAAADVWDVGTRALTVTGLDAISEWTVNVMGSLSGNVGGIAGTINTLDALNNSIPSGVVTQLNNTTYDGVLYTDAIVTLLSMAQGRINESNSGVFEFYSQDNSTLLYTLTKSGNERLRT